MKTFHEAAGGCRRKEARASESAQDRNTADQVRINPVREKAGKLRAPATRLTPPDEERAARGRESSLLPSAESSRPWRHGAVKSYAELTVTLLALVLLTSCMGAAPLKGGRAGTTIQTGTRTNTVTLSQSDSPKQPSSQTVESEQTVEYVLPAGTLVATAVGQSSELERLRTAANAEPPSTHGSPPIAVLPKATPVRLATKDRTETRIGAAQKDTVREWASKAANLQPVMWAGIVMMTLVAGGLAYYGWWTKAALAMAIGIAMVVIAQTLPDHGGIILSGGLGVFALLALLVLYAYHKGKLDQNGNGIPDFLEHQSQRKT